MFGKEVGFVGDGVVIEQDGEAGGAGDGDDMGLHFGPVGAVGVGGEHHEAAASQGFGVAGEIGGFGGAEGGDAGDDGAASTDGGDAGADDVALFLGGEGCALTKAAAGNDTVAPSLHEPVHVVGEELVIHGAIGEEGGGDCGKDTLPIEHGVRLPDGCGGWLGVRVGLGEAVGGEGGGEEGVVLVVDGGGGEDTGDGAEAHAHHSVSGGDGEVFRVAGASDERQAIGGAGSVAECDLLVEKVLLLELGEGVGDTGGDAFDAGLGDAVGKVSDFHGAGKPNAALDTIWMGAGHGGDGDAGFDENGAAAHGGLSGEDGYVEAVAFAGHEGEAESGGAGKFGGDGAAGEDDFIGGEPFGGRESGGDFTGGGFEMMDGGFVVDGSAGLGEQVTEKVDHLVGAEVGIVAEDDGTGGVDGEIGFGGLEVFGGEDVGAEAELVCAGGEFGFVVEGFGLGADGVEPVFDEIDAEGVGGFEVYVEGTADEIEIAEEEFVVGDVLGIAVAHEEGEPAEEVGAEAGLDAEGAARVEEIAEAEGDHSGGGEWGEVAGDDHAAVDGAAGGGGGGVFIEEGDLPAGLLELVGGAEADDASSDDKSGFFHWVGRPWRKGSLGSKRRWPEAMT